MNNNPRPVKSLVAAFALAAAGAAGVPVAAGDEAPAVTAEPAAAVLPADDGAAFPADDGAASRSVAIDCGGYDADGNLVSPEAAEITVAPVTGSGIVHIPDVCGGYTANGTFIGDD